MKIRAKILILLLVVIIIAVPTAFHFYNKMTFFTDDYNNGNLAGNLYNGGYFCEKDGVIYFANPNDGMALYSFDRAGNNLKKISSDRVAYINADDHYLYYTRNNSDVSTAFSFLKIQNYSLCRINKNGRHRKILDSDPCLNAVQVGDYIYYIHYDTKEASTLYRIKIDGTQKAQVSKDGLIIFAKNNQNLYYSGIKENHNLYQLDTTTNIISTKLVGSYYNPIINDRLVYYMDPTHNYQLVKENLETGEKITIVTNRVDCYNIYGDYIYYQRNDPNHPALCRIHTDGTGFEEVSPGTYSNINVTSSFVYFSGFDNLTTFYKTPTTGPVNVTFFQTEILD